MTVIVDTGVLLGAADTDDQALMTRPGSRPPSEARGSSRSARPAFGATASRTGAGGHAFGSATPGAGAGSVCGARRVVSAGVDEAIDLELARGYARVVTTGIGMARIAGHLLGSVGAGSELAVDALVVATAVRLGGGLILTHDPSDLGQLAAGQANVRVVAV